MSLSLMPNKALEATGVGRLFLSVKILVRGSHQSPVPQLSSLDGFIRRYLFTDCFEVFINLDETGLVAGVAVDFAAAD